MAKKKVSGWKALKSAYPSSRAAANAAKSGKKSAAYRKVLRNLAHYHKKRGR
jgi:hypothetical protein